jgi:RNA polymerase sigma-70 factor, ECF subfamily
MCGLAIHNCLCHKKIDLTTNLADTINFIYSKVMTSEQINNIWDDYYPKVYGYFFRRVNSREDVEELSSITMHGFLDGLSNPQKQITNPQAFLWKIAHNQLVTFIRFKSKQQIPISIDDDNDFVIDETEETNRGEHYKTKVTELMQCLRNQLKNTDLEIVELSILDDRKSYEVAEMINISAANVRKRLSRSLQKVRTKCLQLWQSYQN